MGLLEYFVTLLILDVLHYSGSSVLKADLFVCSQKWSYSAQTFYNVSCIFVSIQFHDKLQGSPRIVFLPKPIENFPIFVQKL